MGQKLCYVCYSPDHLIKHCNYHSEYLSQFPKTKPVNQKPREIDQFGITQIGLTIVTFQKNIGTLIRKDLFPNHQYPQVLESLMFLNQYLLKVLLGSHPIKVLLPVLFKEDLESSTHTNLEGLTTHIEYLLIRTQLRKLNLFGLRKKVLMGDNQYFQKTRVKRGVLMKLKHIS